MHEHTAVNRHLKALWVATAASGLLGIAAAAWPGLELLNQPLKILAYAVALYYWIKIAGDHPRGSMMRAAWLLLAASSAVSILRHTLEAVDHVRKNNLVQSNYVQIPILLALILLIGGLFAIWFSFSSIGLGSRFRWSDLAWVAAAAILAAIPYLFSWQTHASGLIRPIVSLSPPLLAAPALLTLLLHRIEQEMGGGQLATSLRLIVTFLILRLLALTGNSPAIAEFTASQVVVGAAGWTSIWFFTLAAAYRWRLTVSIRELTFRYQADPRAELEGLLQLAETNQQIIRK
jgi:hypothetical protein